MMFNNFVGFNLWSKSFAFHNWKLAFDSILMVPPQSIKCFSARDSSVVELLDFLTYFTKFDTVRTMRLSLMLMPEQLEYPSTVFWFHPESEEKHSVHSGYMEPPTYLKLLAAARAIRPFSSLGIGLQLDEYRPSHSAP